MGILPECSQKMLISYLHGLLTLEEKEELFQIKTKNPSVELLFELVDREKDAVSLRKNIERSARVALSYSEGEELLSKIYSGNYTRDEAQQFINALMFSAVFYQHVQVRLESMVLATSVDVPEMAQVRMASDDSILAHIFATAGTDDFASERGAITIPAEGVTSRLKEFIKKIFDPIPGYAYGLSAVALFFILLINAPIFKTNFDSMYVYDEKVPYEYETSVLRGGSSDVENDPSFQTFLNQFNLGMSDYLVRNYTSTVQTYGNIESAVNTLSGKFQDRESQSYVRDLYFYFGLSHFALARSQNSNLAGTIRSDHLKAAIKYLSQAEMLSSKYGFEDKDREIYFLGLAYGFDNQHKEAVSKLHEIKTSSEFYEESVKLIDEWSE